ncbi:MAG TPA: competence protein ComK [Staphylococcus sp.]|nr:competence protein ComK [Staphylococcus sp.]
MIQQYIIKKGDMVLQPCNLSLGKNEGTCILKYKEESEIVKNRTHKIIDRSCRFYGSSYVFKKEDTMRITGISSKPPILFTPLFPTYFFPTHSDRKEENTWINIHYVQNIRALKDRKCKVTFVDHQVIVANISAHSMQHQYLNGIYYYYMMDRAARVATFDPETPIDYTKPQLNIYEALAKYSLFENK